MLWDPFVAHSRLLTALWPVTQRVVSTLQQHPAAHQAGLLVWEAQVGRGLCRSHLLTITADLYLFHPNC